MKSDTNFEVFTPKEHWKNNLKNNGYRVVQTAHCALGFVHCESGSLCKAHCFGNYLRPSVARWHDQRL